MKVPNPENLNAWKVATCPDLFGLYATATSEDLIKTVSADATSVRITETTATHEEYRCYSSGASQAGSVYAAVAHRTSSDEAFGTAEVTEKRDAKPGEMEQSDQYLKLYELLPDN